MKTIEVINLSRRGFRETYEYQKDILRKRQADEVSDCLIFVEHPPVITIGRMGGLGDILVSNEELGKRGVDVVTVERGGKVTFHGPGQLVGYPIMKLAEGERDLNRLLRLYEEAIINALSSLGIIAKRKDGMIGVWVDGFKVASVGVGVRRWVTFHGFAVNVSVDLDWFTLINPCGLASGVMTSVEHLTGRTHSVDDFAPIMAASFCDIFGRAPIYK
jgi:lipoate-protein ligase B